ncbi:glycosyltransferase [Paenarthrobacter nicotinovorans]|uniref:glycosyltransferase n=1 Tax=Paenarthrobacter nicotinovorans TaxID=29320 RepID=UPI003D67CF0D
MTRTTGMGPAHTNGGEIVPTSKLRVTVIVSHLSPTYGLEGVALSTIALLRSKYDVRVVCVGGTTRDTDVCPGALVLGPPLRGLHRLRSIWRLRKFAQKTDPDVVILAGTWVALPWLLVAGGINGKSVVWEHSLLKARFATSKQMRILASAAGFLYKRAKAVVVVSEPLRRDVLAFSNHSNVVTIPNVTRSEVLLADTSARPTSHTGNLVRLINVGSLTPLKAQSLLLHAMAKLSDNFVLNIVGSGPELARLDALAAELGISSRVQFVGYLEAAELQSYLLRSDLMVHSAVAETFGLVYMEAAQCGLPVLSTRSAVAEEMIPVYVPGWLCEADAESLAIAIVEHAQTAVPDAVQTKAALRRTADFGSPSVLQKWSQVIEVERA